MHRSLLCRCAVREIKLASNATDAVQINAREGGDRLATRCDRLSWHIFYRTLLAPISLTHSAVALLNRKEIERKGRLAVVVGRHFLEG